MKVTVAICTWNRAALLRQTLAGLTQLVIPDDMDWEILVVNNNCTDETDAVIAEFEQPLRLTRVFESAPGLSNARNAALNVAAGDYIAFTDDDVLVDVSWLSELAAAARAYPEAAVIGGVIEPWFPEPPEPALREVFPRLRNGYCGLDHDRPPGPLPARLYVWGANMAYRAESIRGLRFDPAFGPTPLSPMGGDEEEFMRRICAAGGTIAWWPSMRVKHYVAPFRMTLTYALGYERGVGRGFVLHEAAERSGHELFGVPIWALRRFVDAALHRVVAVVHAGIPKSRMMSGPSFAEGSPRHIRVLTWRREMAWLGGMLRAYRSTRPLPGPVADAPRVP